MARTLAELPKGSRITDHISLGVLANTFPKEVINQILREQGKESKRHRDLPNHVVVYYAIALALYMEVSCREVLRCLLEGIKWLSGPQARIKVAGRSGISQARIRLGSDPLKALHDQIIMPISVKNASRTTKGSWYSKWLLVSIDGSTLDVADTAANEAEFGRPGVSRGKSGYPQIRMLSLVENGTHVLFGSRMAGYSCGEITLAKEVLSFMRKGMLCMADRNFYSYSLWKQGLKTGADLLWRVKKNMNLPCLKRFRDGSYLSKIYPSDKDRRHDRNSITVRVIEYTLANDPQSEPLYRLLTSILDPRKAPAKELAALYHERWEIENAIDELKTHLRGRQIVLRSKRPDLVEQEFYGLLLAHFAIRGLMHEAALHADEDVDKLSFVHSVRVIRRKMPLFAALPPSGQKNIS